MMPRIKTSTTNTPATTPLRPFFCGAILIDLAGAVPPPSAIQLSADLSQTHTPWQSNIFVTWYEFSFEVDACGIELFRNCHLEPPPLLSVIPPQSMVLLHAACASNTLSNMMQPVTGHPCKYVPVSKVDQTQTSFGAIAAVGPLVVLSSAAVDADAADIVLLLPSSVLVLMLVLVLVVAGGVVVVLMSVEMMVLAVVPSVFGPNLQCKPVKGVNFRDECHWSHACSLQANMRGIQWHPRV
jgi:hypothetical protein